MKRLCALSTVILALTAGPALAQDSPGQSINGTVGAAQVAAVDVAPAAAVTAPVNANAPVTVAGTSEASSSSQGGSSSTAAAGGGGGATADQSANRSAGVAQISSAEVEPAAAANAPVNANAARIRRSRERSSRHHLHE